MPTKTLLSLIGDTWVIKSYNEVKSFLEEQSYFLREI